MLKLRLVQKSDCLYYPVTDSDLEILKHLTNGLIAVNQYGLESLVYPIADIHHLSIEIDTEKVTVSEPEIVSDLSTNYL